MEVVKQQIFNLDTYFLLLNINLHATVIPTLSKSVNI